MLDKVKRALKGKGERRAFIAGAVVGVSAAVLIPAWYVFAHGHLDTLKQKFREA